MRVQRKEALLAYAAVDYSRGDIGLPDLCRAALAYARAVFKNRHARDRWHQKRKGS